MTATESTRPTPALTPGLPRVPTARLVGHTGPVQAIRFTRDGKYCVTGGYDRTVRLWNPSRKDPADSKAASQKEASSSSSSLSSSSLHKHVRTTTTTTTTGSGTLPHALPIQVYDTAARYPVAAMTVNDSSTHLCVAAHTECRVVDLITAQTVCTFSGHTSRINAVATMTTSGSDHLYVTGSYDTTVRIWDARKHRGSNSRSISISNSNHSSNTTTSSSISHYSTPIQVLQDAKDSISAVQVDKDSALLRTASVDGALRTYDVRYGRLTTDQVHSPITGLACTSDRAHMAVSGLDGCIRLIEAASGRLVNTYEGGHVAGEFALECSITADDAYVVTGSQDGSACVYDLLMRRGGGGGSGSGDGIGNNNVVHTLSGSHPTEQPVCSIATHPLLAHTSVVLTAGYDGQAIVWSHEAQDYFGRE